MLVIEDPCVTVKCRTAIKALFLYLHLCLSVKFDSLVMFIYINSFLTNSSEKNRPVGVYSGCPWQSKMKGFLNETIITGNDVIKFENEVRMYFVLLLFSVIRL